MTQVTKASTSYVTTQVCSLIPIDSALVMELKYCPYIFQVQFAISSSSIFSRMDLTIDLEWFYDSILELLEDIDEQQEVDDLLKWWNM